MISKQELQAMVDDTVRKITVTRNVAVDEADQLSVSFKSGDIVHVRPAQTKNGELYLDIVRQVQR